MRRARVAQDFLIREFLLDPPSPDDENEEDENAVQAVEGVDDHPEPGGRRVLVENVGQHLENPREASEQEKFYVKHASARE